MGVIDYSTCAGIRGLWVNGNFKDLFHLNGAECRSLEMNMPNPTPQIPLMRIP